MTSFERLARAIAAETGFTGGPPKLFEAVGRDALVALLEHGLTPSHTLLDFGCGALRLGYWLIRFLDPGCYYGIEPQHSRVEVGKRLALTSDMLEFKAPRFAHNADCDMGVFGETFDYVVARSIFSHMAPGFLVDSLASFRANSSREGQLLASYWRSEGRYAPRRAALGDELRNDDRRFLPMVKYSFGFMRQLAQQAGLEVEELDERPPLNNQIWLCFRTA